MAKIEHYTCDFCGVKVQQLTELTPLELKMQSTAVYQEHTYQVCPWCATTFTEATTKDLFLAHLREIYDKASR